MAFVAFHVGDDDLYLVLAAGDAFGLEVAGEACCLAAVLE